jgi:phage-related baseplate assembly protein
MLTLATLVFQETAASIYAKGLAAAQSLGLETESWETGDPTVSLFWYLAEILANLEGVVSNYIAAGFLDWAQEKAEQTGSTDWLVVLAKQVYNVDAVEATFAEGKVTLTNTKGGLYVIEAQDLTFKNTVTKKTYHNTSGGTLAQGPGTTLELDIVADEQGSQSTSGAGEVDALVTTLIGVTCSNTNAVVGLDAESPKSLADRCRLKLGALSPNGPRDAYNYVALTASLTGITTVTRTRSIGDSDTGDVTLYIAGPAGPVSSGDRDAVEAAILQYATPLTITPNVQNTTAVSVPVTYELWLYTSVGETEAAIKAKVESDLALMFAARPIGGDVIPPATSGKIYVSLIESVIRAAFPGHTFRVVLTLPAADVDLVLDATTGEVATLGAVTGTVNFVSGP